MLLLPLWLGLVIPLFFYAGLRLLPAADVHLHQTGQHFYLVSITSLLAAGVAVFIGYIGSKLRNLQVVLVALAFISLGIAFGTHGFSTPNFVMPDNRVSGITAEMSVVLAALWLFASSFPSDTPVLRDLARASGWLVWAWTGFLATVCIGLLLVPDLVAWIPLDTNPLHIPLSLLTILLALLAAWRYWRSYRFTHAPLQLSVVYCALWIATTQTIISTSKLWDLSWWFYHGILLIAVGVMIWGLLRQYTRGALAASLAGIWNTNPIARLESVIHPELQQLIAATELHDSYTAGHNKRVALHAVQIGQAFGLKPEKLRALAQGGWVHDLGKLKIPQSILNKPSRLEPAERALIEQHPIIGYEYARASGFLPEELSIIRHHHERYDGTGYPDQLSGDNIPLLARITAIADVYDALTSRRSYREPMTHSTARDFILARAGTHFDPACTLVWSDLTKNGALPEVLDTSWRVALYTQSDKIS